MNMRIRTLLPSLMALLLVGFPATRPATALEAPQVERDVPFVPTPEEVVEEMLRMAAVGEKDVVYDLGCGDGRIVISAAREHGARGVGIDIDPERIRESRAGAQEAGVSDRVEFRRANLFEVDFREASVLTLYLLPAVNEQLRPKILRELAPGTRVVSHDFDMGEWQPDRSADVGGHDVYFWMVPANAGGRWEWKGGERQEPFRLTLHQRFQEVSGMLADGSRNLTVREAKIEGERLSFMVEEGIPGVAGPILFEGRIEGNILEGTMRPRAGGSPSPWRAERDPETLVALDE